MAEKADAAEGIANALAQLTRLPYEHKFAFGGLCAILLGKRMPIFGEGFCRTTLARVAKMLSLEAPQRA